MWTGKRCLILGLAMILGFSIAAVDSRAACGDPDPTVVVLEDASIYTISGSQLITVIENPFPDNSLVGYYVAVHTGPRYTDEYFKILSNFHFEQWNISEFNVEGDLEHAAGTHWWYYEEMSRFDIVAPEPCISCEFDEDCDDGDGCTTDTCNVDDEVCVFMPVDCNDDNACTADSCVNGACVNEPISCDDGDACTIDSCDTVTGCESEPIDCDDSDVCTADSCDAGICYNEPICGLADGCCDPSCDPGSDPDCCSEKGAYCDTNADCCSNKCRGHKCK